MLVTIGTRTQAVTSWTASMKQREPLGVVRLFNLKVPSDILTPARLYHFSLLRKHHWLVTRCSNAPAYGEHSIPFQITITFEFVLLTFSILLANSFLVKMEDFGKNILVMAPYSFKTVFSKVCYCFSLQILALLKIPWPWPEAQCTFWSI